MTHISELVRAATNGATTHRGCSREQALVYACEDVAARECPGRSMSRRDVEALVERICLAEDVDVPFIQFGRRRSRCEAWADGYSRTVGFNGRTVSVHAVVHELAHLLARGDSHDQRFRTELVRLARTHTGIEYAALLRSLFRGVGLDQSPP